MRGMGVLAGLVALALALLPLLPVSAQVPKLEVVSLELPSGPYYCDWTYPVTVELASHEGVYIKAELKAFLDGEEIALSLPYVEFVGSMKAIRVFAITVPGEPGEHKLKVALYYGGVEVSSKELSFKAEPFLPYFKTPEEIGMMASPPVRIEEIKAISPIYKSQDPLAIIKVSNVGDKPVTVTLDFLGLEPYYTPEAVIGPKCSSSFVVAFKSPGVGVHKLTALLKWDEHVADHKTVEIEVSG